MDDVARGRADGAGLVATIRVTASAENVSRRVPTKRAMG
jgi:hypothetical protein